jgi:ferrochelatase
VRRLLVLPLYPQYAASTTASTFDALAHDFRRRRWLPDLRFVTSYHRHPAYIAALAQQVRDWRVRHGEADLLLLSYHGLPQRMLDLGDPYHCQCHATSRLLAEALGLAPEQYLTSFQSRLGRAQWLQPYTDATLKALPARGIRSVQVLCPGFAVDCLETLEEIGVENRDHFLAAGGERYDYIPALNDGELHVAALRQILDQELQGWSLPAEDAGQRESRYQALCRNRC